MFNWDIEKRDLKKEIAVEKLKIQRIKTKNFDLTRKISNLKLQIRESMTISSISIISATSTISTTSIIAESVVTITTNYRSRDNNSKEFLNGKNFDVYYSWIFTIKEKISIDAFLYSNEQKKMKYVFFQMINLIFDVLYIWIIDVDFFFFWKPFLRKFEIISK